MKPQPMSDGQIANEWGMALMRHDTTREQLFDFARAILAARDAQWAAMIGEPVAVADMDLHQDHMGTVEALASIPAGSPLYAIKETP